MKPKKPYIDYHFSCIITEDGIISDKRIEMNFSLQTLEQLIYSESVIVFLCSSNTEKFAILQPIKQEEIITDFPSTYMHNLAFDEEICLNDFPNGYCFFPELWQSIDRKILILYYHH